MIRKIIIAMLAYIILLQPIVWTARAQQPTLPSPSDRKIMPVHWSSAYVAGYREGHASALRNNDAGGWLAGGMAGGLCLGLVGTLLMTAIASGKPMPPAYEIVRIDTCANDYKIGFMQAYGSTASSENSENALWGGMVGTAILVGAIIAVRNQ